MRRHYLFPSLVLLTVGAFAQAPQQPAGQQQPAEQQRPAEQQQPAEPQQPVQQQTPAQPEQQPLGQSATLSQEDKNFIEKAAQINMTEAHIGKLATERGSSQDVRQFGEQLRRDHTEAYERLTSLANRKGVEAPKEIDSEHQNVIRQMENLSGEEFDRKFREHQVQDHQKAIDLFQKQFRETKDPDVRTYASEMVPKLQDHLQRTQQLSQTPTTTTPSADRVAPGTTDAPSVTPDPAQDQADRSATPTESTVHTSPAHQPGVHTPGVASDTQHEQSVHYGTVTRFQKDKVIELQMRGRIGRHSYNLADGGLTADVPADIRVGSQVKITEMIDPNGHRSVRVEQHQEPPTGTADRR